MKIVLKKTAALCGSVLIALASGLSCLCFLRHRAYAENLFNHSREALSFFSKSSAIKTFGGSNGVNPLLIMYVDSLLGSTVYGDWDENFSKYNCYAYALGKTDKFYEIGSFYGKIASAYDRPIEKLAERTELDLESLGYECINIEKNHYVEPLSSQKLICLRKSKTDFHFMKYVNGEWLHKPGGTWILRYNGVPTAETIWHFEHAKLVDGVQRFTRDDMEPYTGDIYFFKFANSHNYSTCKYYNKDQHEIKCSNCNVLLQVESHIFEPYNREAKICKKCGYVFYFSGTGISPMEEEKDKL